MNQAQLILEYLRNNGSITAYEAEKPPINCKRLAARVVEIHNGKGVEMAQTWQEMITIPSGKKVARYHLINKSDASEIYNTPEKREPIIQISTPCQECGSYYRRGKVCNICQK